MVACSPKIGTLWALILIPFLHLFADCDPAQALNITVDYKYDTGSFFNTQQKKDVLQAAANRFGAIITTQLSAVAIQDDAVDARIGFTNPTSGNNVEVSPAVSSASDAVFASGAPAANDYRGPWSIAANQWILYVGARPLTGAEAGVAGGGTVHNFSSVYLTANSLYNRGFRSTGSAQNLPMWGGWIAFDNDGSTNWNFDLNSPAPLGSVDFYSVALHEIGHALGLNSDSMEWKHFSNAGQFTGPQAVAAYNADNGTSVTTLAEASANDPHWQDSRYDSYIFHNASPKYAGTVGPSALQDLLMEPSADFTTAVRRFELTNVDAAALRDVGWTTIPSLSGDFNGDGRVNAADYVSWRKNIHTTTTYNEWRSSFGATGVTAGAGASLSTTIPEPPTLAMMVLAAMALGACGARGTTRSRRNNGLKLF